MNIADLVVIKIRNGIEFPKILNLMDSHVVLLFQSCEMCWVKGTHS